MEFDFLTGIAMFATGFASEALWVLDVRRSAEGKAKEVAIISAATIVLSYINLSVAIKDPIYIGPEAAGVALAAYVTCKLDSRRKVKL